MRSHVDAPDEVMVQQGPDAAIRHKADALHIAPVAWPGVHRGVRALDLDGAGRSPGEARHLSTDPERRSGCRSCVRRPYCPRPMLARPPTADYLATEDQSDIWTLRSTQLTYTCQEQLT